MIASRCILLLSFNLLFQQSLAGPHRYGADVSNDEAMIDNLERNILQNKKWANHEVQQPLEDHDLFYPANSFESVPLKIPFAVPPSDLRYYYPSSVLREASLHSNVYGHDSLSPESRKALQAIWNEAAQRQAYLEANYPHIPEEQTTNHQESPEEVVSLHGNHKNAPAEERKAEKAATSNLQASRHHVEQLPHSLVPKSSSSFMSLPDFYFVALVSGLTAVAVCAVVGAGICYFRLHKSKRDAAEAEYPAYGVTGPNKDLSPGAADRKLAQSAHMFHYQHQKQQMIALEKSSGDERHCTASDVDSEEEGDEGDYTVYECPGLAPTGEMEVKNPLFSDDPTPATPPAKVNSTRRDSADDKDDE